MLGGMSLMQLVKLLKSKEYDWVGNTFKLKSRKKN